MAELTSEKKALQDRLRDAESQILQLKTRHSEELKKVVNEKDALAVKLKSAEAGRKRSYEELKQYAMENVTREEHRQSLEVENKRLREVIAKNEKSIRDLRGWAEYYRDDIKSLYTELQEDRPKKKKKTPGRNV